MLKEQKKEQRAAQTVSKKSSQSICILLSEPKILRYFVKSKIKKTGFIIYESSYINDKKLSFDSEKIASSRHDGCKK